MQLTTRDKSDTLSENSTISPHVSQCNVRVNNELDNNQQQYASTYPAPQYDNLPQDISNAYTTSAAPTFSAPQYNNLSQYNSNIAPSPQYAITSDTMAASTYPGPQYGNLPQDISNVAAPQYNNLSYVSVPQSVLQIDSPTMTVYESLDCFIIRVPKYPCPLVGSNNFNIQGSSQ